MAVQESHGVVVNCDKWAWGCQEDIPKEKVISAGVRNLTDSDFLYFDDWTWEEWAYRDVSVDFSQLLERSPPSDGVTVRVGGDPAPLEIVHQQPAMSQPAVGYVQPLLMSLFDVLQAIDPSMDDEFDVLPWLLSRLESGRVIARGKLSIDYANNWHANSPEDQEWEGHSHEWTDIPAGAWEGWGVNWVRSILRKRDGEYIEVRLNDTDARRLAVEWAARPGVQAPALPAEGRAEARNCPIYLDPSHANYSPKLAAAIAAWEAVTADPTALRNKTVKQAIEKWLIANAATYGLDPSLDDSGRPRSSAIQEIAKVANWNTTGGLPKTAGG